MAKKKKRPAGIAPISGVYGLAKAKATPVNRQTALQRKAKKK